MSYLIVDLWKISISSQHSGLPTRFPICVEDIIGLLTALNDKSTNFKFVTYYGFPHCCSQTVSSHSFLYSHMIDFGFEGEFGCTFKMTDKYTKSLFFLLKSYVDLYK